MNSVSSLSPTPVITYAIRYKATTREWIVRQYVDGKLNTLADYYTTDKRDALETLSFANLSEQNATIARYMDSKLTIGNCMLAPLEGKCDDSLTPRIDSREVYDADPQEAATFGIEDPSVERVNRYWGHAAD